LEFRLTVRNLPSPTDHNRGDTSDALYRVSRPCFAGTPLELYGTSNSVKPIYIVIADKTSENPKRLSNQQETNPLAVRLRGQSLKASRILRDYTQSS